VFALKIYFYLYSYKFQAEKYKDFPKLTFSDLDIYNESKGNFFQLSCSKRFAFSLKSFVVQNLDDELNILVKTFGGSNNH